MAESTAVAPALGPGVIDAARAWAGSLARGLAIGVVLGTAYRAWMRLVSTQPEFTWSGTLFIIGSVTVVATLASLCRTARSRWQRRLPRVLVRVISGAAFVLLAAGAGAITLPVWLFGGLARGRTGWNRWVRRALAAVAAAGVAGLVALSWRDVAELGAVRSVVALVGYLALMAAIAELFTWPTGSRRPH